MRGLLEIIKSNLLFNLVGNLIHRAVWFNKCWEPTVFLKEFISILTIAHVEVNKLFLTVNRHHEQYRIFSIFIFCFKDIPFKLFTAVLNLLGVFKLIGNFTDFFSALVFKAIKEGNGVTLDLKTTKV